VRGHPIAAHNRLQALAHRLTLVTCMRKLQTIINAAIKSGTPWKPSYSHAEGTQK
jgi:hypothetical protein